MTAQTCRVAGELRTDRGARAAWSRVAEPGDPRVTELVGRLGAVEALALVLDGHAPEHEVFRTRTAGVDLGALLDRARRHGLRVLVPGDPDWPQGVGDLANPPVCLWAAGPGSVAGLREAGVSVVGARASTPYGDTVASELAAGLGAHGFAVVSGAAYGIDAAAHGGALAGGALTVAVLACGLDRVYPPGNAGLIARIAHDGLVLAEVAPGGAPTRSRFLVRNRLIATLTAGTIVVEAGLRSGSLNTARTAAEHGRPVGAVPGPVTSRVSAGCHEAVRAGYAALVTDAADALELVGRMGEHAAPRRCEPGQPGDELPAEDRLVWSFLPVRAPMAVDTLATHAGVPPLAALSALGRLELAGVAQRVGDRWKRASPRSGG